MTDNWIPIDFPVSAGARKEAEPTDPFVATAHAMATPGYDGIGAMGRAFVEEFALMGWSRQRLERMFRIPSYVAAYTVYRTYGPDYVTALINDVIGPPQESTEPGEC